MRSQTLVCFSLWVRLVLRVRSGGFCKGASFQVRPTHVRMRFADGRNARTVMRGVDQHRIRSPVVTLPHFNAIPPFGKDSVLISTNTALIKSGPLAARSD